MNRLFAIVFGLILGTSTLGCGSSYSNNGGSGSTGYAGHAQGVYSGTSNSGFSFSTIVLPNDKIFAIYGTQSGNSLWSSNSVSNRFICTLQVVVP
jgi:hypothetical protein